MAQKSTREPSQVEEALQPKPLWWLAPAIIGGCVAAIVLPYLHIRYGTATMPREAATAVANVAIFLSTYYLFRRVNTTHNSNQLTAFLVNLAVAVPVFAFAFVGLGFEIPEMADFGAMYIIGTWIATSEAAEYLQQATEQG